MMKSMGFVKQPKPKKQYIYRVYSDYGMKLRHPVEFATKSEAQQYIKDCGCYTKDSEVWIEREEVIENE